MASLGFLRPERKALYKFAWDFFPNYILTHFFGRVEQMGTKKTQACQVYWEKKHVLFLTPRSKISLIKWDPPSCQAAAEILAQAKVAGRVRVFFFSRQLDFFFFRRILPKIFGICFFSGGCLCFGFWDFGSGTIPWVLRLFSFGSVFFGWFFYGSDPMEFITINGHHKNHHFGEYFWNFFLSHRWSTSEVEKKSMLHPGKFSRLEPTNHPWKERKMIWTIHLHSSR